MKPLQRKTRTNGGPSPTDSDADPASVAEKSERFAGLPYRMVEAFADGELNSEHILIAWWLVSHITPPMWRFARTMSALSRELHWEDELGKSQRTLQRRVEELGELGWFVVTKPQERSRKPWVFRLGMVSLERLRHNCDTSGHDCDKSTPRFVAVDTLTGELLDQSPSGLEGGSVGGLQDIDVDSRQSIVVKSNRSKGLRGVPR